MAGKRKHGIDMGMRICDQRGGGRTRKKRTLRPVNAVLQLIVSILCWPEMLPQTWHAEHSLSPDVGVELASSCQVLVAQPGSMLMLLTGAAILALKNTGLGFLAGENRCHGACCNAAQR